jgi:hypothetical protein
MFSVIARAPFFQVCCCFSAITSYNVRFFAGVYPILAKSTKIQMLQPDSFRETMNHLLDDFGTVEEGIGASHPDPLRIPPALSGTSYSLASLIPGYLYTKIGTSF